MFLITDKSGLIVNITDRIFYVKTQSNEATVMTTEEEATAVHSDSGDSFWLIRDVAPGNKTYEVLEVDTVPEWAEVGGCRLLDGEIVPDHDAIAEMARAVTQRPVQLRADIDYMMLMEGL